MKEYPLSCSSCLSKASKSQTYVSFLENKLKKKKKKLLKKNWLELLEFGKGFMGGGVFEVGHWRLLSQTSAISALHACFDFFQKQLYWSIIGINNTFKVYSLMGSYILTHPQNYHHNQVYKVSTTCRNFFVTLIYFPFTLYPAISQANHWFAFCHCILICVF